MISEGKQYKMSAHVGHRITRMQTGSLPAVSPSSSTTSIHSKTFSRRLYSKVILINYVYYSPFPSLSLGIFMQI